MKLFIFLVSIFSVILVITGCTKLAEKPIGVLSPEGYFKTQKDVEAAIFAGYGLLSSDAIYGRFFDGTGLDLRSDMVAIGNLATAPERIQVNDFNVNASSGLIARWWPIFYQVISTENSAVEGAGLIDASDEIKNRLRAEARFVRAFSYYHLVQVFGDLPYIDMPVSNPGAAKTLGKTPAAEVWTKIIEDFKFAKENLPDQQPGDVRSRPTKGTAAAFLASAYLTTGDYQQAATEAKWVIDNKTVFNYELEADYQDLFNAGKADGLKEPLFVIDYASNIDGAYQVLPSGIALCNNCDAMGVMTAVGAPALTVGFDVLVPSQAVYDNWNGMDYRKAVSFDTAVLFAGNVMKPYTEWPIPRPHIAKYIRFPGAEANSNGTNTSLNYMLMRYAEVLLIAAEALTEVNSGPTAEALDYVNQVRGRARNWAGTITSFPADVAAGMSKDDFIDLVLEERRFELAFEFKRWYDIKRRQLGDKVFKGPNSLEPHGNFDSNRDYLFPIPGSEIDINPNLLPQNAGY
jgi:hypothetical protein